MIKDDGSSEERREQVDKIDPFNGTLGVKQKRWKTKAYVKTDSAAETQTYR